MESNVVKRRERGEQEEFLEEHKTYMRVHVFLRVLTFISTLVAALCMGLSKQSSDIAGFQLSASYKSSPAFKFFLVANAIACAYSLLSVFFTADLIEGYLFHLLDLMILSMLMASAAATTAIAYVGKRGNEHIGWSMVCPYYEKFCNKVAASLIFCYLSFVLLLLMCALSYLYKTRLINNL